MRLPQAALSALAADDPAGVELPDGGFRPDALFDVDGPDGAPRLRTLLQTAAYHGSADVIRALLALPGANAGVSLASPTDGATALHCACSNARPTTGRVVSMLVQAGASTESRDFDGRTPGDLIANFRAPSQKPAKSADSGRASEPRYCTDEFRMFSFKIEPCPEGHTEESEWTDCPFMHEGEKARRRDPRTVRYQGVPCPDYRKGACRRGDACPFSHGVFESWLHPARYRTQLCKEGAGCSRTICFFAHSVSQLREPTHAFDEGEAAAAAALRRTSTGGSGPGSDADEPTRSDAGSRGAASGRASPSTSGPPALLTAGGSDADNGGSAAAAAPRFAPPGAPVSAPATPPPPGVAPDAAELGPHPSSPSPAADGSEGESAHGHARRRPRGGRRRGRWAEKAAAAAAAAAAGGASASEISLAAHSVVTGSKARSSYVAQALLQNRHVPQLRPGELGAALGLAGAGRGAVPEAGRDDGPGAPCPFAVGSLDADVLARSGHLPRHRAHARRWVEAFATAPRGSPDLPRQRGTSGPPDGGFGSFDESLGDFGPLSESLGGLGPLSESLGGLGPLSESLGGLGPLSESLGGLGPLSESFGGLGPLSESLASLGLLSESLATRAPWNGSMAGSASVASLSSVARSAGSLNVGSLASSFGPSPQGTGMLGASLGGVTTGGSLNPHAGSSARATRPYLPLHGGAACDLPGGQAAGQSAASALFAALAKGSQVGGGPPTPGPFVGPSSGRSSAGPGERLSPGARGEGHSPAPRPSRTSTPGLPPLDRSSSSLLASPGGGLQSPLGGSGPWGASLTSPRAGAATWPSAAGPHRGSLSGAPGSSPMLSSLGSGGFDAGAAAPPRPAASPAPTVTAPAPARSFSRAARDAPTPQGGEPFSAGGGGVTDAFAGLTLPDLGAGAMGSRWLRAGAATADYQLWR